MRACLLNSGRDTVSSTRLTVVVVRLFARSLFAIVWSHHGISKSSAGQLSQSESKLGFLAGPIGGAKADNGKKSERVARHFV